MKLSRIGIAVSDKVAFAVATEVGSRKAWGEAVSQTIEVI